MNDEKPPKAITEFRKRFVDDVIKAAKFAAKTLHIPEPDDTSDPLMIGLITVIADYLFLFAGGNVEKFYAELIDGVEALKKEGEPIEPLEFTENEEKS